MEYYLLKPEVAGEFGENTIINHSVEPFEVVKLHYKFSGWLGDELLTSFPCVIGTVKLINRLESENFKAYSIADVEISTSYEFRQLYPDRDIPEFRWIKIHGIAGKDDLGLSEKRRLVVSDKVMDILKTFNMSHCRIEEYLRKD